MRTNRAWVAFLTFVLVLVACSVQPPEAEMLGQTREALSALGQRCIANAQCQSGFCVDTVCCDTACGFGARDAVSCSNVYGVVPGLVEGHCKALVPTNPCGSLVTFNPCAWRGSDINGGGNCPAPGNEQTFACEPCTTSADCPSGLPVCIANGCTACTGDFGTGGPSACPTAGKPACVAGACVECSQTNATACTGNKGSCDVDLNLCVGCSGDFGSPPGPTNEFPCTNAKPACLPSGACAECSGTVACTKDPTKTVCDLAVNTCVNCLVSTTCPAAKPVCTNKQCTQCNGNHGSGASSACPTTTEPACVPSPSGPGTCEQCSASDVTACAAIPGKPVCDTTSSVCVQCNAAPDCAAVPGKPFCNSHVCTSACVDDGQCGGSTPRCKNGVCVGCIDDTTCAAPTPFCDVATNACVECRSASQCPSPTKPVCSAAGACVPCDGDNGSASPNACPSPALPACNVTTGACVQCNAGNGVRCTGATPVCNTATNVCVECVTSGNCVETGPRPVCNTATNACEGCNADNGTAGAPPGVLACPGALRPACVSGSCFECKDGAFGTNVTACTPGEPVCKDATHDCVQCRSNGECAGASGLCNLSTNTCGPGCASDANCTSPTPRCKVTAATCVECLDFNDCGGARPQCNTTTNTCVECVTDGQCPASKPSCDGGTCVPCNGDFGSGATHACRTALLPACRTSGPNAGSCAPCSPTNSGNCVAPTSACDPVTSTCVECVSNAQCSGAKPICSAAGTCVPCNGDLGSGASAACATAALPACATSGVHTGQCVECRSTNLTACTSGQPVCHPTDDVCVQCNSDAQCTGVNGKCNLQTHTCTLGCATNASCSSSAPVCNGGICVECTGGDPSLCVANGKKCDAATNTCVGCLTAADCPNTAPICSSVTRTCTTDCTKSSECPATAPICNPATGKCVACSDDAQCGGATPRCDLGIGTCTVELDAGAPDAGPIDAGTDAADAGGPADAGPRDAGGDGGGTGGKNDGGYGGDGGGSSGPPSGTCVTDRDCPSGAVCDPVSRLCRDDSFSVQGGGCSCRTEAPSGNGAGALLGFGLVGALVWRRRRDRKGSV